MIQVGRLVGPVSNMVRMLVDMKDRRARAALVDHFWMGDLWTSAIPDRRRAWTLMMFCFAGSIRRPLYHEDPMGW